MTYDLGPEREYVTALQRCAGCEGETALPLIDGFCPACIAYRAPAAPASAWAVDIPGPDGLHSFSILHVRRDRAEETAKRYPGATIREAVW